MFDANSYTLRHPLTDSPDLALASWPFNGGFPSSSTTDFGKKSLELASSDILMSPKNIACSYVISGLS
jgi:hypothetical protein